MPELPEVETIVRSIRPLLVGKVLGRVRVLDLRTVAGSGNIRRGSTDLALRFEEGLVGEEIVGVGRRAKNFFLEFASGKYLVGHLKMTGKLLYEAEKGALVSGPHVRVIFELSQGVLVYDDIRRFGSLLVYPSLSVWEATEKTTYGLEPLSKDFTLDRFVGRLWQRPRLSVKAALLRQDIVAGIGNIYCDEACFRARLHPGRVLASLETKEMYMLHRAIKYILSRAIRYGGSSVSDYVLPDGRKGSYARFHRVYGRAGKPCSMCGISLQKQVIAGRTTVYCPACQNEHI